MFATFEVAMNSKSGKGSAPCSCTHPSKVAHMGRSVRSNSARYASQPLWSATG